MAGLMSNRPDERMFAVCVDHDCPVGPAITIILIGIIHGFRFVGNRSICHHGVVHVVRKLHLDTKLPCQFLYLLARNFFWLAIVVGIVDISHQNLFLSARHLTQQVEPVFLLSPKFGALRTTFTRSCSHSIQVSAFLSCRLYGLLALLNERLHLGCYYALGTG